MRLFVGVELGEEVRREAEKLLARLRQQVPSAKWIRPDALHLTLVFLGETAPEKLSAIEAAMTRAASLHAAHTLVVAGGGTFGLPQKPRVLWADIGGEVATLRSLQRTLHEEFLALGHQQDERPFSAHLTLARSKHPHGDRALALAGEVGELGKARIEALLLFQSHLSPAGASYATLVRKPLMGR